MTTEENKAIVNRVWQEILNEGKLDLVDELIDADYVYQAPGGYEIKGIEGMKRLAGGFRKSFPDLNITVDDLIAEGDKVVSRFTMRGTHKDTNHNLNAVGIIISRIVGGKVVEDWVIHDRLQFAEQLASNWIGKRMVGAIAKRARKELP